jgi:hypothetical protein
MEVNFLFMATVITGSILCGFAAYHAGGIKMWFGWIHGGEYRKQIAANASSSNEQLRLGLTNALHRIEELERAQSAIKLQAARNREDVSMQAKTRGFLSHRKSVEQRLMQEDHANNL